MSRRIIRRKEVERRTGQGRSAIYNGMAESTFPKQVPLGPKAVGWLEDEIDAWIEERVSEREAAIESRRKAKRDRKSDSEQAGGAAA